MLSSIPQGGGLRRVVSSFLLFIALIGELIIPAYGLEPHAAPNSVTQPGSHASNATSVKAGVGRLTKEQAGGPTADSR